MTRGMGRPSHDDDGTLSDVDLMDVRVSDIEAMLGPIEAISDDEISAEAHAGAFDVGRHLSQSEQADLHHHAIAVLKRKGRDL